ncbi:MAG: ABC transporter permease [Acidimicrobiia bacterium]
MSEPLLEVPPPELRYRRGLRLGKAMRSLWAARHLIFNLGFRELRVTYSQAIFGLAWSIVTPFVLMLVFSLFIQKVTHVQTYGAAYPVFSYTGLLAWTFFSGGVASAGAVLVGNPLLNKVSAPREVFVLATIGTSAVNAIIATGILCVMFVIYGDYPQTTSVWVPLLLLILVMFTVGIGLIFSAAIVYLRDIRFVLPLMLQVGLFATPVLYGLNKIPSEWRAIYVTLNPVAMVIDGLRLTVLRGMAPNFLYLGLSGLSSLVVFVGGYALFKQLETGFADVS